MDFVQDSLYNGERFRILTVVDNFSKKCLSLLVGKSLKGHDVASELRQICLIENVVRSVFNVTMVANLHPRM